MRLDPPLFIESAFKHYCIDHLHCYTQSPSQLLMNALFIDASVILFCIGFIGTGSLLNNDLYLLCA